MYVAMAGVLILPSEEGRLTNPFLLIPFFTCLYERMSLTWGEELKKKKRMKNPQKTWHAHTMFLCLLLSDDACHLMCESHVCFNGINCNKTASPSLSYEFMNLLRETQSFKIPLAYGSETMFSFNLPAASARREPHRTTDWTRTTNKMWKSSKSPSHFH